MTLLSGDSLIKKFGQHQLLRKGEFVNWSETNQIRGKLRFLARLLQAVHTTSGKTLSMSEMLKPQFYDVFVSSVLEIRKENKQLAFTLGHYVKKLCLLKTAEAIKSMDDAMKMEAERFLDLYNSSWSETVSSSTLRMQQKQKINKTVLLPTISDLEKLTKFVAYELSRERDYTRVQKLVIMSLILFNKRRPAEVANITFRDYNLSLHNQEDREEIIRSLSPEEKAVAGR